MLLTKEVSIPLGYNKVNYYESLGYKIPRYKDNHGRMSIKRGTYITINVKDLSDGSHNKVSVKCDYCNTIKEVAYKDYLKNHDDKLGDCCIQCRKIKFKTTMLDKYGTVCSFDIPGVKEKTLKTNRKKYGCDWQMQSKEVQQKSKDTMLEKYGVEHALQSEEFYEKMWSTMTANGKNHASKPQIEIYNILKEMYNDCLLEVVCGKCSLDCVVKVNDTLIDVEYDGHFWHKDKNRDIRRDNFVKTKGYKIFRIKGAINDPIPSKEQLKQHIDKLLSKYTYTELIM